MRLAGRVALVFGAGSSGPGWGNGKAAAVMYAREGARVIAVDLNRAAAEETATIIAGEGNQSVALAGDITKSADVADIVGEVVTRFGAIDILHNNVGITDMGGIAEITDERWQKVMDINLTGVFLTCRQVIPVMQRQKRGAIINISSIAGAVINPYPYYSYFASKAGLNHFTRAIAVQYAKDVTAFLMWTAEPHLEARKQLGLKVMLFLLVFASLLYYTKKKIWSKVEGHAHA